MYIFESFEFDKNMENPNSRGFNNIIIAFQGHGG